VCGAGWGAVLRGAVLFSILSMATVPFGGGRRKASNDAAHNSAGHAARNAADYTVPIQCDAVGALEA
jgi:hypothetical protein